MSVSKQIRAKFERTSFGTPNAQAARRSVSTAAAQRVVTRSAVSGRFIGQPKKDSPKSGG